MLSFPQADEVLWGNAIPFVKPTKQLGKLFFASFRVQTPFLQRTPSAYEMKQPTHPLPRRRTQALSFGAHGFSSLVGQGSPRPPNAPPAAQLKGCLGTAPCQPCQQPGAAPALLWLRLWLCGGVEGGHSPAWSRA